MKRHPALWAAVLCLVLVRLHNWWVVPPEAGYDSSGHILYLHQVVTQHRLPRAQEGWMDYQPPAYYVVTAAVAWISGWTNDAMLPRAGALVSALSSIAILGVAWGLGRRLVPDAEAVVVLLMALVPVNVIMGGIVSNMAFAALLGGLFLERLAAAWDRERLAIGAEALLGLLAGLAFLGRLENLVLVGLLPLLAVGRVWARRLPWRDALLGLVLAGAVAVAVCTVYVFPNLARFNRPLVSNNDPDIFPYFQSDVENNLSLPGFHTASWFLLPDATSAGAVTFPAALPSLWATTYASFWSDYFRVFVPDAPAWRGQVMKLAGLPLLVLLGLGIRRSLATGRHTVLLVAPLLLSLSLYTVYQLRLPQYWCDKAVYCSAAYLPGAALIALALQPRLTSRTTRWVVDGLALTLAALVTWTYWL